MSSLPHSNDVPARPRVVVAGAGFVGLAAAAGVRRRLGDAAEVVVVSPRNHLLFLPLLPEVASGAIEPRHAVAPLRKVLRGARFFLGRITGADPSAKTVQVQPPAGAAYDLSYDHLVVAVGSEPKALPIPGLEEHAVTFNTVAEALHLRNAILSRVEIAESTRDPGVRESALTAVFIGGGYTGVEAMAELHHLAKKAAEPLEQVEPSDIRWVLVEAADRILPNLPLHLADEATVRLRRSGIDVRLGTTVDQIEDGVLSLSDGTSVRADTVVFSAGMQPNPALAELNVPLDDAGRLEVDRHLRVPDHEGLWGAGDGAAVPRPGGGTYPPTAEQATRQGAFLGENLARAIRGEPLDTYAHGEKAELVTLGGHTAMGTVGGMDLTGVVPWLARRAYYATAVPGWSRRLRLTLEWTIGALFPHDPTQLDALEDPGLPLRRAVERSDSA